MRSAWYVLFGFGLALVLTTAAYLLAAFGPDAGPLDGDDSGLPPADAAGPDSEATTNDSGNESTAPEGNVTRRAADPPSATRT